MCVETLETDAEDSIEHHLKSSATLVLMVIACRKLRNGDKVLYFMKLSQISTVLFEQSEKSLVKHMFEKETGFQNFSMPGFPKYSVHLCATTTCLKQAYADIGLLHEKHITKKLGDAGNQRKR